MRKIFAALMLSASQLSIAGELVVLDIKFDQPFEGGICPSIGGASSGANDVALSQVTQPCIGPKDQNRWNGSIAQVWIPHLKMPPSFKNPIRVWFNGDSPKAMTIEVGGVSANAVAYELLKEKFGTPTKAQNITKQNAYGAKFEVIEADWQTPNFEVSFNTPAIDKGSIFIAGPAATAKNIEVRAKQAGARKPSL